MKLKQLRKCRQEKHGYANTKSYRAIQQPEYYSMEDWEGIDARMHKLCRLRKFRKAKKLVDCRGSCGRIRIGISYTAWRKQQ